MRKKFPFSSPEGGEFLMAGGLESCESAVWLGPRRLGSLKGSDIDLEMFRLTVTMRGKR